MAELLFVDVIRRHLETLPDEKAGWLAGLRNPLVARALALLHNAPAQNWTLDALAPQTGTSRSVLAERFVHIIGQPPMQYLRNCECSWRVDCLSRTVPRLSLSQRPSDSVGGCVQSRFQEVRWPFSTRMASATGRVKDGDHPQLGHRRGDIPHRRAAVVLRRPKDFKCQIDRNTGHEGPL